MFGDGFEQNALGASVSFPKGVKRINFAKVKSQSLAEQVAGLAAKTIFTAQLSEDALAFGCDKFVPTKQALAFAHRNSPQLTGPRINIPENVPMNLLEMVQIQFAGQGTLAKLI